MGEEAGGSAGTDHAGPESRNYVVVSADTHASPDSLDHFLSYVDPAFREAVASFGDMSSLAISMFGGFDPGEVDESDPVRATAARRLAGMGVDTDAAKGWLAHYGTDWVVAGRRRRAPARRARGAGDPCRGHPARADSGGRPLPGHVPGRDHRQGTRRCVARAARLCALAGRLLRRRAGSPRRMHADRLPRHGPRRRRGGLGPRQRHLRWRHAPRHVGDLQAARLRGRLLRALLERVRGPRHGRQPPHGRVGLGHRHQVPLRRRARGHARASTRSSSSPAGRCGS